MKQYKVLSGQNIYDVSITLYGGIEGVFDLLKNNPSITFNTTLTAGMILDYDESYVANQTLVNWIENKGMTIRNGEHYSKYEDAPSFIKSHIVENHPQIVEYIKTFSADEITAYWEDLTLPKMLVRQRGMVSSITLNLYEGDHLFVDWGDADGIRIYEGNGIQDVEHCYRSEGDHEIKIYGQCRFHYLDFQELNGVCYPLSYVYADKFNSNTTQEELNKLIITQCEV